MRAQPFIDRKFPDFCLIAAEEDEKTARSLTPRSSRRADPLGTQAALRRGQWMDVREVARRLDAWDARNPPISPEIAARLPRFPELAFLELHPALDIRALSAGGLFKEPVAGHTLGWTDPNGTGVDAVLLVDRRGEGVGRLILQPLKPESSLCEQAIDLIGPPAARRLYLRCPYSGAKTDLLFLRGGYFASRQINRLVHQSQRKAT